MSGIGTVLSWIRWHAGRRGAFLAFLTVLDFAFGYSIFALPRAAFVNIDTVLPVHIWAWIWIGAGVVCGSGIFMKNDRIQYTLSSVFKTAWGLLYAYLWWQGVPNAWPSVVVWLSFAMTVVLIASWREEVKLTIPDVPQLPKLPEA
jgi:hypothetical protein